jgi:hypothetical protein
MQTAQNCRGYYTQFISELLYNTNNNKGEQFFVPLFVGLFLGLFGALIQKNALDRPQQL